MGSWTSCLTEDTLCLTLPCKGRAAGALLQMSPRLGQNRVSYISVICSENISVIFP